MGKCQLEIVQLSEKCEINVGQNCEIKSSLKCEIKLGQNAKNVKLISFFLINWVNISIDVNKMSNQYG